MVNFMSRTKDDAIYLHIIRFNKCEFCQRKNSLAYNNRMVDIRNDSDSEFNVEPKIKSTKSRQVSAGHQFSFFFMCHEFHFLRQPGKTLAMTLARTWVKT